MKTLAPDCPNCECGGNLCPEHGCGVLGCIGMAYHYHGGTSEGLCGGCGKKIDRLPYATVEYDHGPDGQVLVELIRVDYHDECAAKMLRRVDA